MSRYPIVGLLIAALAYPLTVSAEEVVVYSARNEHLIKPLFDRYTAETGVQVTYLTDKAGPLIQRLAAEGRRTPADMLITVDAGNLWQATQKGVLAKTDSDVLNANVPAELRDPDGHWYGLSKRARTVVYSTERVKPEEIRYTWLEENGYIKQGSADVRAVARRVLRPDNRTALIGQPAEAFRVLKAARAFSRHLLRPLT